MTLECDPLKREMEKKVWRYEMKVLIVKTSSLGDIVHALPAVTEASHFLTSIQFDWLVARLNLYLLGGDR